MFMYFILDYKGNRTLLVQCSDGAFRPVNFAKETSILKPHDDLPVEAEKSWVCHKKKCPLGNV